MQADQWEGSHVEKEAETELCYHKLQNLGDKEGFGGSTMLSAPVFQMAGLQNCDTVTVFCFKEPSLCCFVLTARGN